jgi:hypothetical protein
MMAGVQGILIPLAADLGGSREIEERLLSPLSVTWVALEKVVAGAIHASAAGLIALPLMILLMHQVSGVDVRPRWPCCCRWSRCAGVVVELRPEPRHAHPGALRGAAVLGAARADDAVRLRRTTRGAA